MKVSGVFWHGSPYLFDKFYAPKRFQSNMQLGFGVHLAKSKEFASRYGNNLYRCRVELANAFSMNHIYQQEKDPLEFSFAKRLYRGNRRFGLVVSRDGEFVANVDIAPAAKAVKLLNEFGFDGVLYTANFGSTGFYGATILQKSDAVVCLHPDSIEILDIESAIK